MKILVIGGTFAGVAAACALSRAGHDVILSDARGFLGGDVVAAQHTYLMNFEGGCPLGQPNGTVKMELYSSLRAAGVKPLLMSRLCGILTDGQSPCGAAFASKFGIFTVSADLVIDATESGLAASKLTGKCAEATEAEYGFDMSGLAMMLENEYAVPEELGVVGNKVHTVNTICPNTVNVGFRFAVSGIDSAQSRSRTERKAHELMCRIAAHLRATAPGFENAVVTLVGSHTRLTYPQPVRCDAMPFVEARLSSNFTLAEKQELIDAAVKKALCLAETTPEHGMSHCLLCAGQEIPFAASSRKLDLDGLQPVTICMDSLPSLCAEVVVAGAGTGGAMSAWALKRKNRNILLCDALYFCGGTNTVGRVYSAWHGYTDAMFQARYSEVDAMEFADALGKRVGGLMYWEHVLGNDMLGGVTVCGTEVSGRKVTGVLICTDYGLMMLRGDYVIDGTADGDVCDFAGVPHVSGGVRDGMMQTASMWGFEIAGPHDFGMTRYNSDEDVFDPDSFADLQRGLSLGYLKNSPYEIVEMCMQRESRRFSCRYSLTMAGIARRECHKDDIAVALCTHDSHGRPSSLMNQLTLFTPAMIEAGEKDIRIRMPLSMFLPVGLDNIAIVGKSMSGEREAVSLCRMNPDISNSAFAVGLTVAYACMQKAASLSDTDLTQAKTELHELRLLPEWAEKPSDSLGIEEALAKLDDPADRGFAAMVQPKDEIVPLLKRALTEGGIRAENAAMALAWHGEDCASEQLLTILMRELENDPVRFEKRENYNIYAVRKDGFEKIENPTVNYGYIEIPVNDPDISYTRVNELLVLLGLAGGKGIDEVLKLAACATPGELLTGRRAYARSRIDGHRLMGDERLWAIVHACERLANPCAAAILEKLMDSSAFSGIHTEKGVWSKVAPPRVTYLGLALARAATHCGSLAGAKRLISFLDDARSVFAGMARKALSEVYGVSLTDADAWTAYVEGNGRGTVSAYRGNPFEG